MKVRQKCDRSAKNKENNMTTKKKNNKTVTKTVSLFPEHGMFGFLMDVAITVMFVGTAFMMMMLCVQLAEKITITFGK
jgi:hypothetical protein